MQGRYELQNKRKLHEIIFSYKSYSDEGKIEIYLKQPNKPATLQEAELLSQLLTENNVPASIATYDANPYKRTKSYFLKLHPRFFRAAVDQLHHASYIADEDYANLITGPCQKIQTALTNQLNTANTITVAQKDSIEAILSIYIDSLLEAATDKNEAINLLHLAFSHFGKEQFPEICWHTMLGHTTNYPADKKKDIADSLTPISKAFHGGAELESTFKKMGASIPALSLQRSVIANYAKQKFADKFPLQNQTEKFTLSLAFAFWCNEKNLPTDNYYKPCSLDGFLKYLLNLYEETLLATHKILSTAQLKMIFDIALKETDFPINELKLPDNIKSLFISSPKQERISGLTATFFDAPTTTVNPNANASTLTTATFLC